MSDTLFLSKQGHVEISTASWQKWMAFTNLVGIPEEEQLNLSEGWLSKFKGQAGLKEFRHHREAASAEPKTIEQEQEQVQKLI